ncbi:MAG: type III-B CRISPR module RAMP protein Cmr6 [Armatimonadota bacterium]
MATPALRESIWDAIVNLSTVSHAGLLLDKGLKEQQTGTGGSNARKDLFEKLCGASCPEPYKLAFRRWQTAVQTMPSAAAQVMKVKARLIVGLGGESVLETGLTLHHTYGMPFIPGSALKGLARHYAEQVLGITAPKDTEKSLDMLSEPEKHHRVLFGTTDDAGYVTFLDALYVPDSAPDDCPLALDTITTHHPKYYTGGAQQWPWDFDDPNPVSFISVRGSFLVAVLGPTPEWAKLALDILTKALQDYGVGGKTSSGYGRLMPDTTTVRGAGPSAPTPTAGPTSAVPAQTQEHPLVTEVKAIPNARVKPQISAYYDRWQKLTSAEDKRAVARAMIDRMKQVHALESWKTRPWVADLLKFLGET